MASNGNEHGLFWGSNNGDRKYNAESFERWLKKFFTTGVFNGDLQVTASSGMTISVGTGYANLDGKVRFYDTNTLLTLSPANSVYPRIDTIVMTRDNINRDIFLEVVTGTYSGDTPSATAPVRDVETFQIVLAEIYVEHGITEITQAQIIDKRQDTAICGYITGTVTEMDFSQFAAQFNSYYQQFEETNAADFDAWFQNLQDELTENQAANLQRQIGNLGSLTTPANNLVEAINGAGHPMLGTIEEVAANTQPGKVVDALVVKEINNNLTALSSGGDITNIRINPDDSDALQWSTDGGSEWHDFFKLESVDVAISSRTGTLRFPVKKSQYYAIIIKNNSWITMWCADVPSVIAQYNSSNVQRFGASFSISNGIGTLTASVNSAFDPSTAKVTLIPMF